MPKNQQLIEAMTKALHSSQFLVSDLKGLFQEQLPPALFNDLLLERTKAEAMETHLKALLELLEMQNVLTVSPFPGETS